MGFSHPIITDIEKTYHHLVILSLGYISKKKLKDSFKGRQAHSRKWPNYFSLGYGLYQGRILYIIDTLRLYPIRTHMG